MPALIQRPSLLAPLSAEDIGQLKVALPSLNVLSYQGPGDNGGVSNSLEPLAKQLESKVRWLAVSGLPEKLEPVSVGFSFHRLHLPPDLLKRQANFLRNYLHPLFHGHQQHIDFDPEAYKAFRHFNELAAADSLAITDDSYPALFWLHDYQLLLTAPLLAAQAGVILCHFWHVPWPAAEIMVQSAIAREILEALLANRLLGFQTEEYAQNFLNTVQEVIPEARVDQLSMQVSYQQNTTELAVMPLGIDFAYWQKLAKSSRPKSAAIPKKFALANQLVLAVDRLEQSKGLLEKLCGLEIFLQNEPSWHRRFHYVQLTQEPHFSSAGQHNYKKTVLDKVQSINATYNRQGWQPILWLEDSFSQEELASWYQAADVMCVTPISDGLNLIAKEFTASRLDEQGVLILSRQTAAAAELSTGALLVDARQPQEIAQALSTSFSMSFEEKRRRMLSMRHVVAWNRLDDWALGFLQQAIKSVRR